MIKILLRIFNKLGFRHVVNSRFKIAINGKKFVIPVIHGIGFNHPDEEGWFIEVIKRILAEKPGAFIDIGVNIGQTLLDLRCVNEATPYIGFEPNFKCVSYVDELIRINEIKNASIIGCGISNEDGVFELLLNNNNSCDETASLVPGFKHNINTSSVFVPVLSGNTILNLLKERFSPVSILKVDVEGAELEVLQSLSDLILVDNPVIIIEILPVYEMSNSIRLKKQQEIEMLLATWGYSIYRVQMNQKFDYVGLTFLEEFGCHSDLNWRNYLLIPNRHKKALLTKLN